MTRLTTLTTIGASRSPAIKAPRPAAPDAGASPRRRGDRALTVRDLLSFRLHVVANLLSRGAALSYRRQFGVSLMEWRSLALLGGEAPLSLGDLARLAGLDKSQMSRVMAGLTARALVLRAVDGDDARGVQLSLTAAGRKIYNGLIAAANLRNDAFLAALDANERRVLEAALDKLAGVARDFINAERQAARKPPGRGANGGRDCA